MADVRLCGRPRLSDGQPCGFRINGDRDCIWHGADATPDHRSSVARRGAMQAALNASRILPDTTPAPRWRSRSQIVTFLEEQANLVRTGQLDRQIAAEVRMHAETALKAYELEALEKLDSFERVLNGKARRIS